MKNMSIGEKHMCKNLSALGSREHLVHRTRSSQFQKSVYFKIIFQNKVA